MIAIFRINGLSAQEAYNEVSSLIDARFSAWENAMQTLPSWGYKIDWHVRQYIQGIQDIVQANLSWRYVRKHLAW